MSEVVSPAWKSIAAGLFPQGNDIRCDDCFLQGTAVIDGETVAVFGSAEHTPIGVEIALASARFVLDVVRDHPGRAIVMLVDTDGQRLRRRDELLGINAYMAHLGKCVELARARGHRIVALIYERALSGGFITSGMMADACYALPQAEIRVMKLPAMARVTKQPLEKLEALSLSSPVFAPGAGNYLRMGAIEALWRDDLAAALAGALRDEHIGKGDRRAQLGEARGGRKLAAAVAARIMASVADDERV